MINKLLEKPFKLLSLIGIVYVIVTILLKIIAGFPLSEEFYPFSNVVFYTVGGVSFILCILSFIFYNIHIFYYINLELLVFSNLYDGQIYVALFLSAILLVLLLSEKRKTSHKEIIIYGIVEVAKLALVIPFGVSNFFYYVGLNLFALCVIGCVNLLFRHAYSRKESGSINLDELKLSDRQKKCIEEIVINNTTIKALSIDYNVSESAIKKDLAHIYKVLGISGKADLKALFIDYKFH